MSAAVRPNRPPGLQSRMVRFLVISLLHCLPLAFAPGAEKVRPEMLSKYLDASERSRAALRGVQMEASIEGRIPKLAKKGNLTVIRSIVKLGRITYMVLTSSGDRVVRQDVIARYLTADSEQRGAGSLAITPANYRFRLIGGNATGKRLACVFELTPRKKKAGLFKGELWVDRETGMPLGESGQMVKSPLRVYQEDSIRSGVRAGLSDAIRLGPSGISQVGAPHSSSTDPITSMSWASSDIHQSFVRVSA